MMDAALVGMRADHAVGDADRYPDSAFLLTFAHDLEDPALVLVSNRKALAFRAIAIGLHEFVDNLDRFAGRASALQCDIDQRTVVDDAVLILQVRTAAKCGLHDDELMLIHVAHSLVRVGNLGDLATVKAAVPVVYVEQRPGRMIGGGTKIKLSEKLVGIGGVGYHAGTIGGGSLGYDDIGAGVCRGVRKEQHAGGKGENSFHSVRILVWFCSKR